MRAEDVPPGPVLLDTSAFSHLLRGGEIADRLAPLTAGHELVVSFVTVGELIAGATRKGWGKERLAQLELRLAGCAKVAGSEQVARAYGRLKAQFGSHQDNDLWIAACALAQDPPLPIVTTDKGFDAIGAAFGLTIVRPD